MKIIGLTGYKQSGKDTVCSILAKGTSFNVKRLNFADALKQEVADATGHPVEFIEKHKANFRHILQGWGTDYRRQLFGDNYWIVKWIKAVNNLEHPLPALLVVTDVRFLNEAEAIRQMGGRIYRVFNPRCFSDGHASETELNQIVLDGSIDNSTNIANLQHEVLTYFLPHILA